MLGGTDLRNEWRLLGRHPLVWLALTGIAAFSLLIAKGSPSAAGSSPSAALLRLNLFLPAFMLPFIAGALGPIAYLREVEAGLGEMIGSYPVTVRQWLAARLGTLVLVLLAACLLAQGMFVAVLGPRHPGSYLVLAADSLKWLAVVHAPACLLWASLMAWLASRRGHPGLLYFIAGAGWMAYLGLATLTGTPLIAGSITPWPWLKQAMFVLDPYAVTALVNPMPDGGPLQWRWINIALGRAVWLGLCLVMLHSIRALPAPRTASDPTGHRSRSGSLSDSPTRHLGMHLRYLVRDRVFPLLVLGWIALILPEAFGGMGYAEPLSRLVPDSRDALNRVVWDVLPLAGSLVLLYIVDRTCRMYPQLRMHELYAATPHSAAALLAVQLASVAIAGLALTALTGLAVAAAQLLVGSALQGAEYLTQLGLVAPGLLLFGLLFVAIHALVRRRLLANLACFVVLALGLSNLAPALGLFHPLWKPVSTPLVAPDHAWGFGGGIPGHLEFLTFWALFGLGLLLLGAALRNRTMATAQARAAQVLRSPAAALAALCLAGAGGQGAMIDTALRAEGALTTPSERARLRADYERGYAGWSTAAQPDVESVRAQIDFYPQDQRAAIRATLRLVNRSGKPIDTVLVGERPLGGGGTITLEQASITRRDARLGQTVYRLDPAMMPGETRELGYTRTITQSGLETASFPLILRERLSSLPAYNLLPVIGFAREMTLRDPVAREKQDLPMLNLAAPSQLTASDPDSMARERVLVDAVVSTAVGQYAIGQGTLLRRWQAGGRSYSQYRTDHPIRNLLSFFSVPGEPQVWPAGQVTILTHTPGQLQPGDANVLAIRDTLGWLGSAVAPYPGTSLHVLAVPQAGSSGYALPQIVQLSHRLAVRARPDAGAGFSQIYRRAAHETAHQWFGHMLGYGRAEERAFLIESLAKYAELVVIERRYGQTAMQAVVAFERDRYHRARNDPHFPVVSLIDAQSSEDMYSRATLAFACLRSRVGDGPIIAALKASTDDVLVRDRPATSLGFLGYLKAASPADQAGAIDLLFLGTRPIEQVERELGCRL